MKIFLISALFFVSNCGILYAYSEKEICDAVYIVEGKEKARQPFGIETIECKTYERCKQICHNTVINNKIRYKQYGHKEYRDFLEFLQSRYCPLSQYLCKNWLSNLKYYLKQNEKN